MYLGETQLSIGKCSGTWSTWGDRDNPSGVGDWETLNYRKDVCEKPIAVEARIVSSQIMVTSQNVQFSLTGLVCTNENQPAGEYCLDYEVRYCCPFPDKPGFNPGKFINNII